MQKRKALVLVADGDSGALQLMEGALAQEGIETHSASDGVAIMALAASAKPDAVAVDSELPQLDGVELCRRMGADPSLRNVPVVILVDRANRKRHQEAVAAGCAGLVCKPVQEVDFSAAIGNALRTKALANQVEELMRQRRNVTSVLTHDVNNLSSVIMSYTELGVDMPAEELRECLVAIQAEGREVAALTRSLNDAEKLEAGTMKVVAQPVDVWPLVTQRLGMMSHMAHARNIRLEVTEPYDAPTVNADPVLLGRVVDGLLMSGIKQCPPGGLLKIHAQRTGSGWLLHVQGDGTPIPPELHGLMFDRFAAMDSRQRSGLAGTAMALAFCKIAVEAMGGSVLLVSPLPGRADGVGFTIRLRQAA